MFNQTLAYCYNCPVLVKLPSLQHRPCGNHCLHSLSNIFSVIFTNTNADFALCNAWTIKCEKCVCFFCYFFLFKILCVYIFSRTVNVCGTKWDTDFAERDFEVLLCNLVPNHFCEIQSDQKKHFIQTNQRPCV